MPVRIQFFNLLPQIVFICNAANIDCFMERLDNTHLVNTIKKALGNGGAG